ncbi:MAG TPA: phosphonate ABC transporter, permease protein PhnE [Candidatus Methylomirabilis sp.]|nr:phosphonate ABC transporter, permease protein PhnE [Candidatus Methylomirabilis sp.]
MAAQGPAAAMAIPLRPRSGVRVAGVLVPAGIALLVAWSWRGTGFDPVGLLGAEGRAQMLTYARKLFPPDLSSEFMLKVARWSLETFAISFMGTLLSIVIAFSLVFVASRNLVFSGILFEVDEAGGPIRMARIGLYVAARAILNLLRTVPHIVWALIFVFAVGLGPFPGVLALGLHTGGVLGKLFAEVVEDMESQPLEALYATGASRTQIFFYGVLPRVLPQFLAYSLYRWEVNIREAIILGYVGAGGLGQQIQIAISLFLENKLLTLILAIYLMVTLVDYLSASLRRRLL